MISNLSNLMKKLICYAALLASAFFASRGFAAETTNTASASVVVPPPVPGYPVGWCIRARPEVFVQAKALGYEYVELALQDVYGLPDADFSKLAAVLQEQGLPARSGYNPIPKELKLVGPNVDATKLDAHVSHLLERAATLKLPYIVLSSSPSWTVPVGFDHDKAFAQLADFSGRFADSAAKAGITVLIEPMHGPDVNMITNMAEALKLVETVNRPNFQMMVDYSFLTIQKDDMKELLAVGKHLRNVHISNPAANRTYAMNDSESDYATFFKMLKQIGYRGGLSVHGGPVTTVSNDAPKAIAFLRTKAAALASGASASAPTDDLAKSERK
jgi:D-psicose/D-tagatose/L-ribulose 3-epimerase